MAVPDLETYRAGAEAFLAAIDTETYLHFSGQKPVCDTAAVYDRFPELFTREAVAAIEELFAAAQGDEKYRLAFLAVFAIDGYIGEQTKLLSDEVANTEGRTEITVDGERIGLRQAVVVQANEADGDRRARIQAARLAATDEHLNPLLDQTWSQSHALAGELGYPNYAELYSDIKGLDYRLLQVELDAFMDETSILYEQVMSRLVRERLGIPLSQLRFSDLPHLWRAAPFDGVFTSGRLLPTLRATLAGLDIDVDAQGNVHLDTQVRELKSPRAFCAPVRVPDEIYLSVLPQGGQDDYAALLHEAGHTEHFAHTDAGLSFEFRHLGDNAVTEAFAFLFDHLLLNRQWLARYLDFPQNQEFVWFANVVELYFIRRYAAKLGYELELHTHEGPLEPLAEAYSRRLSKALLVDVPPESYLADVDDGFYCASYLRAWLMEGALRMMLQDRFGMEWFRSPEAGAWVKDLWAHGQHYTAERLLLKQGGGRLSPDPLRHHFERALGR